MFPQVLPANAPKVRMHYLSVDEATNTILVTGPADKIAQAEAIIKKIDVPQQNCQKPVLVGPATFKTYSVPGGNADVLAKNLQDVYRARPPFAWPRSAIIRSWSGPDPAISRRSSSTFAAAKEQDSALEVIPLTSLDPSDAVDILKGMFGDSKIGAPYLKADTAHRAIIAKGTPDQVGEIKFALKALGEGTAPPPRQPDPYPHHRTGQCCCRGPGAGAACCLRCSTTPSTSSPRVRRREKGDSEVVGW